MTVIFHLFLSDKNNREKEEEERMKTHVSMREKVVLKVVKK